MRLRPVYDAWNRLVKVESWKDADTDGVQDTGSGEDWSLAVMGRPKPASAGRLKTSHFEEFAVGIW